MQLNVSETDTDSKSYSELIHRENIPGTPFTLITVPREQADKVYKSVQDKETKEYTEEEVETDGDVSFGTLGRFRITPNRKSQEEVREEITFFSWDMVMKLLAIIVPHEVERVLEQRHKGEKGAHKQQG